MQIRTVKLRLFILTSIALFLSSCSISDWYNGYYVEKSAIKEGQRNRDNYYNSESPQMQELRKHNDKYCSDLASRPENRVTRDGYPNGVVNQAMFIGCMENHGTPTYESYASMQKKKHDEERRAKGKRVM
ncbi:MULTISPECIES: hypothetical protein [unclassified Snodgrassella]|uniref:hypothetical protein n=1 Tax=unclassified Snodgrassella TaxID=2625236 RepID=UPI0018DC5867|nr:MULTISPECIES: hypothetical protein [unclassified Snodgrassella]MBI0068038.1 hypothetical protein [Snodgrassella sp. M0110]MBI0077037.1 hypothetical protein [Snodgrassella sp. M0118]MBI0079338.1 hypothetical protein [Snodgrassella sp. M0112]